MRRVVLKKVERPSQCLLSTLALHLADPVQSVLIACFNVTQRVILKVVVLPEPSGLTRLVLIPIFLNSRTHQLR